MRGPGAYHRCRVAERRDEKQPYAEVLSDSSFPLGASLGPKKQQSEDGDWADFGRCFKMPGTEKERRSGFP